MAIFGLDIRKFVSGAAQKIVPKIVTGGSSASQQVLKNFVASPISKPVFDKFGAQAETGLKVAGGIAATALLGGAGGAGALGSVLKSTSGNNVAGSLIKNFLPAARDIDFGKLITTGVDLVKGALSKPSTQAQTTSKQTTTASTIYDGFDGGNKTVYLVIGGVVLVFVLFGKQLKRMFR